MQHHNPPQSPLAKVGSRNKILLLPLVIRLVCSAEILHAGQLGVVRGVGAGLFNLSAAFKAVGEPAPTGYYKWCKISLVRTSFLPITDLNLHYKPFSESYSLPLARGGLGWGFQI
jgi:hypothetical protein